MKSFFETLIQQKKINLSKKVQEELIRTALKIPEVDELGKKWSEKNYPNGFTSYGSLSRLHEQFSVFDQLKKKLDVEVKQYCKALKFSFPRGKLELSTLWINLMPKNCFLFWQPTHLTSNTGLFPE